MNVLKYFKTTLYLLSILLALLFQTKVWGGSTNTVILNEVFFDPVGIDTGYEWIELYNYGDKVVSINNWRIMVAGSWYTESSKLTAQIQPKSYLLVCEPNVPNCNVYVTKLALQNGGGNTDAISILDNNNNPVDQIFYDLPNTNGLTDYMGNVVTNTATTGGSGESLGRVNFIDTDNSANDFVIYSKPTPGSLNEGSLIDDELPQTGEFPINILIILLILIFFGILLYNNKLFLHLNAKREKINS